MKRSGRTAACIVSLLLILLLASSCSPQAEKGRTAPVSEHTTTMTEDFSTESQTAGVEKSLVLESPAVTSTEITQRGHVPFYVGRYYHFSSWDSDPRLLGHYLDESAGFITDEDLPGVILDCYHQQPAFYELYNDQTVLLYSLEGELLCEYDRILCTYEKAYGDVIIRGGQIFDPYTQTIICDGAEKLEPINEKQTLVIYFGPEDQYAQTIRGIFEAGAAEIKAFPLGDGFKLESMREHYLIVKDPEGDYHLLGEDLIVKESFSGEGFDYCRFIAEGTLEFYAEDYHDLVLLDQGRRYRLTKESDLYRIEHSSFIFFTNGHLLWGQASLYHMDGSLIKEYDELHHLYKENRFIVRDGSTLMLLDKEGEEVKKVEIPNLSYTYMLSNYDNLLICEVTTDAIAWSQYLDRLYSLELDPITDKWYTWAMSCGENAFWVHEIDLETEKMRTLIIDLKGNVIMEEPRRVGSADDFAIAVEKGMYVGLIDYQGNWIARRKIYEAPWYQFNDD